MEPGEDRLSRQPRKVVIVGAGPVGCLAALSFAKMGWQVEIYEIRPDTRLLPAINNATSLRSINLTISARGIMALQAINPSAAARFLESFVPMKGRMIHSLNGKQSRMLYDRSGMSIHSFDRRLLNEGLLEDARSNPNIQIFFRHKMTNADFDKRVLSFLDSAGGIEREVQVEFDFCIGADGSYSSVRRHLMKYVRMDYHQEYIQHEYVELKMPALRHPLHKNETLFPLDPNHLHIWPRHSFMLIALPNQDKSFTCTLFAPTADFSRLRDSAAAVEWFKTQFPDAVPLIGEDALLECFENNPRSPLIAIKAKPYHYKDRVVIIGDAAHCMVPFYGQGLNCGFEDVRVLETILRNEGANAALACGEVDPNLENALNRYSESRHDDLVAISDLAANNYIEMRHTVMTPSFFVRRGLDNMFYFLTSWWQSSYSSQGMNLDVAYATTEPTGWIPLYTMVTFRPDISYSVARRKAARQGRVLTAVGWIGATLLLGISTFKGLSLLHILR